MRLAAVGHVPDVLGGGLNDPPDVQMAEALDDRASLRRLCGSAHAEATPRCHDGEVSASQWLAGLRPRCAREVLRLCRPLRAADLLTQRRRGRAQASTVRSTNHHAPIAAIRTDAGFVITDRYQPL